jgi:HrpA-like RNA helicase
MGKSAKKTSAPEDSIKGAYTIDEGKKIAFTDQLLRLREGEVTSVSFPADLDKTERKFIHKICEELGLKSKSRGQGEKRFITVTKATAETTGESSPEAPNVHLGKKSLSLLEGFDWMDGLSTLNASLSKHSRKNEVSKSQRHHSKALSDELNYLSARYHAKQLSRAASPDFPKIIKARESLPASKHQAEVCEIVRNNQVVLVSGETGCGKTTQVPQFLLDDPTIGPCCKIMVTQPRRISAISVAERIAAERGEKIGSTIGYNVKLQSESSRETQVLFVTPGVLLRKLFGDPTLEEYSHIIIDEAHERDKFTEFTLMIIRDILSRRASLKLVLMSATLNTTKLSSYFGGVPQITMGGSVFPVQEFFLEDCLRVTNYMKSLGSAGAGKGAGAALTTYEEKRRFYSCPMCGKGSKVETAFRSPEELGTHLGTCTGSKVIKQVDTKGSLSTLRQLVREVQISTVNNTTSSVVSDAPKETSWEDINADEPVNWDDVNQETVAGEGTDQMLDADDIDSALISLVERNNPSESSHGSAGDQSLDGLLRAYQMQYDDSQVDYSLILELLKYICKSEYGSHGGSVLIFLPGWEDISKMSSWIETCPQFTGKDAHKYKVIQLHSCVPKKSQMEAFQPVPPGCHKMILSTNIAETSITIDDIIVVIDSGRVKEKTYDPYTKLCYLKSSYISKSSARQRKGRAGRTRAGVCFHLFSRRRHQSFNEFQDSELLRMPLEELVLQTKALHLAPGKEDEYNSARSFLLKALDPPADIAIWHAIQLLKSIGMLTDEEDVTGLGRSAAKLPVEPRLARTILLGCLLGCGPSIVTVACGIGYRSPFTMPTGDAERMRMNKVRASLAQGNPSDQIALLKAIEGFSSAMKTSGYGKAARYCDDKCLSMSTLSFLNDFVKQINQCLKDENVDVSNKRSAQNNGNLRLIQSIVAMGMYPDVGVRKNEAKLFTTEKGRKARLHNSSILSKIPHYLNKCQANQVEMVAFQNLIESSGFGDRGPGGASLSMLEITPLSTFGLLLSCGKLEDIELFEDTEDGEEVIVSDDLLLQADDWVTLRTSKARSLQFRACRAFLAGCIEAYALDPSRDFPACVHSGLKVLGEILSNEQTS